MGPVGVGIQLPLIFEGSQVIVCLLGLSVLF